MKKVYVVSSVSDIDVFDDWVSPDISYIDKIFLNFDEAYNYCLNEIENMTNYFPKERDKILQNSYILFQDEDREYPIEVFYKDGLYRYWELTKNISYNYRDHTNNFLISEVDLIGSEED